MSRFWTHKVVKQVRNGNAWSDLRTAATFDAYQSAAEYAAEFADEQRAARLPLPVRIVVRKRNGLHVMGITVHAA